MKQKLTLAVGLLLAAPLSTFAAQDGPGCGLGQVVWEGKSGLVAHTSAATTNGTLSNQVFGITFGTLGCDEGAAVVQSDYEKKQFVASNIDGLAQDVAQGQGDHLHSLASLMGIDQKDRATFFSVAQANYEKIFVEGNLDYMTVIAAFDTAMAVEPALQHYVR